ncbi:hypothetical protein [Streptomyces sp. DB-54]
MTVRAAWLTNRGDPAGGQTRNDSRLTPLGTMTPAGELTTLSGVIPGGAPLDLGITGPMGVTLGPGRAVVQGTDIQGAYPVVITAPEALIFTDGDAANPRLDVIVLRVYDGAYDESGQVLATAEIIPGTPAAAPTPPPLPAGALPLYRVAVPAGASAGGGGIDFRTATTDLRRPTVSVGGINPNPDAPGTYRAQYRDRSGLQRWSGSAWVGMATELITWTKAPLAAGYSHNGNSNGNVEYRVVELVGTRLVQWRGGMNVTYRSGAPARGGAFLTSALPTTARPTGLRSLAVACSAADSKTLALKIDFLSNGTATLVTDSSSTPPWVSFHGVMYSA